MVSTSSFESVGRICHCTKVSWWGGTLSSRWPIKLLCAHFCANDPWPPPSSVCVLSFDGHFGVHRNLNPKWGEAPRTVRCRGRPRKKYTQEQRTCTCANKAKQRVTMKNRTAGWQFVIDPKSRRVLAAKEHLVNECSPDKVEVVRAAMKMKKVNANAIIHDDACHFEAHVHRHQFWRNILKTSGTSS